MHIRVNYTRGEVEQIILEYHTKLLGLPPKGEQWVYSYSGYGDQIVENKPLPPKDEESVEESN